MNLDPTRLTDSWSFSLGLVPHCTFSVTVPGTTLWTLFQNPTVNCSVYTDPSPGDSPEDLL